MKKLTTKAIVFAAKLLRKGEKTIFVRKCLEVNFPSVNHANVMNKALELSEL